MINLAYNVLTALLSVPARWWLRRHPTYGPLVERFNPPVPSLPSQPVWIQACSLGEVNTVRPLIEAMKAQEPDRPILITASTLTGYQRATDVFGPESVAWFPFDTRRSVRRFLDRVRPLGLVLVETELWPNVLFECRKRKIPVILINGRLSDRKLKSYMRLRWWYGPMVRALSAAGMQSDRHVDRIQSLGASERLVHLTGNLKFDAVRVHVSNHARQRMRIQLGLRSEGRALVFGSTRPGDEALASACWATLREEYPDLTLVIAPRHIERVDEIVANFSEPVRLRSDVRSHSSPGRARVVVLDTTGELVDVLSLASVAVVGGSFYPGVNGHNPLEAAALGIPVVFGPYMTNFADAADVLSRSGGAKQLACAEDLYLTLSELLGDAAERRQMGTRARKAVLDNQGAVRHTIHLIEETLSNRQDDVPSL